MSEQEDSSGDEPQEVRGYLLGKTVGQGTFNKVKVARHIVSNEQVAVKMIEKRKIVSEADKARLDKELKILRKARHPNIVQLFEILQSRTHIMVVTEYAVRGELFDHIVAHDKLTQFEASKYLHQMVDAIEYMHELGVAHRDLKPENLLLDYKYNLKIIDFGLSNIYSNGQLLTTACGSPCYAPPEMIKGLPYHGLKADIWSLGIVLYAMVFGYLPFEDSNNSVLFNKILEGKYQVADHASAELKDILSIILQVDSCKRASLDQIRSHPFCKFSPMGLVPGIIVGLSDIPVEDSIVQTVSECGIDTTLLKENIKNNKHNQLTTTYYLLLQRHLRLTNSSSLSYYLSKQNLINRYKIIEKVRENYEKHRIRRINEMREKDFKKARRTYGLRSTTAEKKRIKNRRERADARTHSHDRFKKHQHTPLQRQSPSYKFQNNLLLGRQAKIQKRSSPPNHQALFSEVQ